MSSQTKKFRLPRGEDKTKREFTPVRVWRLMVMVGGVGFFAIFLWAYVYFLRIVSLEEMALSGASAEILRVVDQEDLRRAIDLLEIKEAGLGALASSSPVLVDPSR